MRETSFTAARSFWRRAARRLGAVLIAFACACAAGSICWRVDVGSVTHSDGPPADLVDHIAVSDPYVMSASSTWLSDDAEIIGVAAGGRHRAYLVRALQPASRHVLNDTLGGQSVTLCYCVRTDTALVLTAASKAKPPDVAFGGYLGKYDFGSMLLRIGPWHYRMDDCSPWEDDAPPFPYTRGTHERTTWKAWLQAHPDTDAHVGEPRADPTGQRANRDARHEVTATRPHPVSAAVSQLRDETDVIGVSVGGRHRAYPVRAFRQGERHVIADDVEGIPVAVTFCGIAQCAQAFIGGRGERRLDLSASDFVGEYDWGGLVLRIGSWHYVQSTGLPLEKDAPDFPYARAKFERMSWKRWRDAHPDSEVYSDELTRVPSGTASLLR